MIRAGAGLAVAVLMATGLAQGMAGAGSRPLDSVKRIYVDSFGTDAASRQVQAILVSDLVATKRFVVTEVKERADAIVRGSAITSSAQEVHAYSEGTSVGTGAAAAAVGESGGSAAAVAKRLGAQDSSVDTQTVEKATVSVRLVSKDGDVIWSTTQESHGGKYQGASADAVEACVRQLVRDAH